MPMDEKYGSGTGGKPGQGSLVTKGDLMHGNCDMGHNYGGEYSKRKTERGMPAWDSRENRKLKPIKGSHRQGRGNSGMKY